jgi:hypothetical protein
MKKYDMFVISDTLICYAGETTCRCDVYEVLSNNHGTDLINIPNYKPLHEGLFWGYDGFKPELYKRRNGKRPRKSTVIKIIKELKELKLIN